MGIITLKLFQKNQNLKIKVLIFLKQIYNIRIPTAVKFNLIKQ